MAGESELSAAIPAGSALRFQCPLRSGGAVGLTDDRLFVVTGEETVAVRLVDVTEVTFAKLDWFLVTTSLAVVAFGVLSLKLSVLGGLAFGAFGVASLYWTYRKRDRVVVRVDGRPKPLGLYPAAADDLREHLDAAMDRLATAD